MARIEASRKSRNILAVGLRSPRTLDLEHNSWVWSFGRMSTLQESSVLGMRVPSLGNLSGLPSPRTTTRKQSIPIPRSMWKCVFHSPGRRLVSGNESLDDWDFVPCWKGMVRSMTINTKCQHRAQSIGGFSSLLVDISPEGHWSWQSLQRGWRKIPKDHEQKEPVWRGDCGPDVPPQN